MLPFSTVMRFHSAPSVFLLVLGSMALAGTGCAPEAGTSRSDEILVTEDVGGAVDTELSTEGDRRGPRWVESGQVLPPGFPVELPVPAGASVVDRGSNGDGKSFVVLGMPTPASSLGASWASLLEVDGWSVRRSSESGLSATKAELTVTTTVSPAGSGSRLRIVYE